MNMYGRPPVHSWTGHSLVSCTVEKEPNLPAVTAGSSHSRENGTCVTVTELKNIEKHHAIRGAIVVT